MPQLFNSKSSDRITP